MSAELPTLGLLLSLLMLVVASRPQDVMSYNQIILTSRCRAVCIGTFVKSSQSDAQCIADINCYKCWGMCENLLQPALQYLCREEQKHVCNDGCQAACGFMETTSENDLNTASDAEFWDFPARSTYTPESDTLLKVRWEKAQHVEHRGGPTVYTLLWTYDELETWSPVCTTSELWADVKGPHYQYPGLAFLLLAVTSRGVVTEARPVDLSQVTPQSDHNRQLSNSLSAKVDLVEASPQAIVSWKLSAGQQPGLYQIQWGRDDCECEETPDYAEKTIQQYIDSHQESVFELPGLTYNSKFWVELVLSHGVANRVYFYTPYCEMPDPSCTLCQQSSRVFTALNVIKSDREPLVGEPASLFSVLGFCVAAAGVIVTIGVLVTYKHKQLTVMVSAQILALKRQGASFKQSFRSRTSSLRSKLSRETSQNRRKKPQDLESGSPGGLMPSPLVSSVVSSSSCRSTPQPHTQRSLYSSSLKLSPSSSIEDEADLDDCMKDKFHGVLELDLTGF